MNFTKALMVGVSVSAAGLAVAADPFETATEPPPGYQTFAQMDTNRDGVLSFSEVFANPKLSNNFNLLDKNGDGVLSRDEVQALIR